MNDRPPGPQWNVEDFPASYNGTPIVWDPDNYDTAAIPFVVAVKHQFWSWRVRRFEIGTGYVTVEVQLPSALPDGFSMISFDEGDTPPHAVHDEFAELLRALGGAMLDSPWTYTLIMSDRENRAEFTGQFGPGSDA